MLRRTLLLSVLVLAGCDGSVSTADGPAPKPAATLPTAVASAKATNAAVSPGIITADNQFGVTILQALQAKQGAVNEFVSPLSLSMALQIAYLGASGTTQDAMSQTLQLGSLTKQQVNDANAALQASLLDVDPQVQLNQTFIDAPYNDGTVKLVRPPFTIDDHPTRFVRSSPEIGDDTVEVLTELGYDQAKIDDLLDTKVVYDTTASAG